jgi:hypothetical protein
LLSWRCFTLEFQESSHSPRTVCLTPFSDGLSVGRVFARPGRPDSTMLDFGIDLSRLTSRNPLLRGPVVRPRVVGCIGHSSPCSSAAQSRRPIHPIRQASGEWDMPWLLVDRNRGCGMAAAPSRRPPRASRATSSARSCAVSARVAALAGAPNRETVGSARPVSDASANRRSAQSLRLCDVCKLLRATARCRCRVRCRHGDYRSG